MVKVVDVFRFTSQWVDGATGGNVSHSSLCMVPPSHIAWIDPACNGISWRSVEHRGDSVRGFRTASPVHRLLFSRQGNCFLTLEGAKSKPRAYVNWELGPDIPLHSRHVSSPPPIEFNDPSSAQARIQALDFGFQEGVIGIDVCYDSGNIVLSTGKQVFVFVLSFQAYHSVPLSKPWLAFHIGFRLVVPFVPFATLFIRGPFVGVADSQRFLLLHVDRDVEAPMRIDQDSQEEAEGAKPEVRPPQRLKRPPQDLFCRLCEELVAGVASNILESPSTEPEPEDELTGPFPLADTPAEAEGANSCPTFDLRDWNRRKLSQGVCSKHAPPPAHSSGIVREIKAFSRQCSVDGESAFRWEDQTDIGLDGLALEAVHRNFRDHLCDVVLNWVPTSMHLSLQRPCTAPPVAKYQRQASSPDPLANPWISIAANFTKNRFLEVFLGREREGFLYSVWLPNRQDGPLSKEKPEVRVRREVVFPFSEPLNFALITSPGILHLSSTRGGIETYLLPSRCTFARECCGAIALARNPPEPLLVGLQRLYPADSLMQLNKYLVVVVQNEGSSLAPDERGCPVPWTMYRLELPSTLMLVQEIMGVTKTLQLSAENPEVEQLLFEAYRSLKVGLQLERIQASTDGGSHQESDHRIWIDLASLMFGDKLISKSNPHLQDAVVDLLASSLLPFSAMVSQLPWLCKKPEFVAALLRELVLRGVRFDVVSLKTTLADHASDALVSRVQNLQLTQDLVRSLSEQSSSCDVGNATSTLLASRRALQVERERQRRPSLEELGDLVENDEHVLERVLCLLMEKQLDFECVLRRLEMISGSSFAAEFLLRHLLETILSLSIAHGHTSTPSISHCIQALIRSYLRSLVQTEQAPGPPRPRVKNPLLRKAWAGSPAFLFGTILASPRHAYLDLLPPFERTFEQGTPNASVYNEDCRCGACRNCSSELIKLQALLCSAFVGKGERLLVAASLKDIPEKNGKLSLQTLIFKVSDAARLVAEKAPRALPSFLQCHPVAPVLLKSLFQSLRAAQGGRAKEEYEDAIKGLSAHGLFPPNFLEQFGATEEAELRATALELRQRITRILHM